MQKEEHFLEVVAIKETTAGKGGPSQQQIVELTPESFAKALKVDPKKACRRYQNSMYIDTYDSIPLGIGRFTVKEKIANGVKWKNLVYNPLLDAPNETATKKETSIEIESKKKPSTTTTSTTEIEPKKEIKPTVLLNDQPKTDEPPVSIKSPMDHINVITAFNNTTKALQEQTKAYMQTSNAVADLLGLFKNLAIANDNKGALNIKDEQTTITPEDRKKKFPVFICQKEL